MSDLSTSCCEIPYYLTDTMLKYNLFKSSLVIGDESTIIPLYIKFYYGDSNTNPRLIIVGPICFAQEHLMVSRCVLCSSLKFT